MMDSAGRCGPCLLVVLAAAATCRPLPVMADAIVALELRPPVATAAYGELFALDLYAIAEDESVLVSAMDVVLTWDPSVLSFVGFAENTSAYDWLQSSPAAFFPPDFPDGLNGNLADGDAKLVMLGRPGAPVTVHPQGLKIGSLQFAAPGFAATTPVQIVPSLASGSVTAVYGAQAGQVHGLGTLDGSLVHVSPGGEPVPTLPGGAAPLSAALMALAGACLVRRKVRAFPG